MNPSALEHQSLPRPCGDAGRRDLSSNRKCYKKIAEHVQTAHAITPNTVRGTFGMQKAYAERQGLEYVSEYASRADSNLFDF